MTVHHINLLQFANSVLNSSELDDAVVQVMVTARSDGYAQGYEDCANHVSHALKVKWDNTRSAVYGVDTSAAYAVARPIMISCRFQSYP